LSRRREVSERWPELRFGSVQIATHEDAHVFEVQVFLGAMDPNAVAVELYADPRDGAGAVREAMTRTLALEGETGGYLYTGKVTATRPAGDYTPRIVPHGDGVAVPLEAAQILWQR
jgi:starch phosphorylase